MCVFAWCMGVWVDGRVFATLWLFNLNMQIESRLKTRPAKSSGTKKKKCKFNAQFTQPQKCATFCVEIEMRVIKN